MKLIWYPSVSLDGLIADSTGRSDFVTEADERQFAKLVHSAGALVVGRRTFAQYHQPRNPFPKVTTYVLTTDIHLRSDDPAVVYVTGGPMEVMRRLHADSRLITVLSGGGQTSGLFAAKGLIDEAWISINPLVMGAGTPMLGDYRGTLRLDWREGFMLPGGIVHNRYEVR